MEYLGEILNDETSSLQLSGFSLQPILVNLIGSLLPNTVNNYQFGGLEEISYYNLEQLFLVNSIFRRIRRSEIGSIGSVLEDAKELTVQSNLDSSNQMPIMLAVEIGLAANKYWKTVFDDEQNE